MKNNWSSRISTLLLLLSSIASIAQAQEYQSGKLHAADTVCKDAYSWMSFYSSVGSIVGESYHPSCAGKGKNAWVTKFLESGDTICTVQHSNHTSDYYAWQTISNTFNTVTAGWSENCPPVYINSQLQSSNTTYVEIKPRPHIYRIGSINGSHVPQGYVATRYGTTSNEFYIQLPSLNERTCNSAAIGYVRKDFNIHTTQCVAPPSSDPIKYTNTYHIKVADEVEFRVLPTFIPVTHIVTRYFLEDAITNYYPNGTAFSVPNQPLVDIKRPNQVYENACKVSIYSVPTGYRVVGYQAFSADCLGQVFTLKKIQDIEETICSTVFGSSSGSPLRGQNVPITYTKVADVYDAQCPNPYNYPHNAWLIRRIADF